MTENSPWKTAGAGLTLERQILERQHLYPQATGDFTKLLQQIALAAKIIASKVNKAGLAGVLGYTGEINVQGEHVQKLDVFAHNTLVHCLGTGGHVCIMGSEEEEHPIFVPEAYPRGKYVVLFDPLDGSGNIDINGTIGTIFSIYKRKSSGNGDGTMEDCLQPGSHLIAAGYVIYGSSNMLVYSTGKDVQGFTFDPAIGEFFLSHENIQIPEQGKIFSVNEGYRSRWRQEVRDWVDWLKSSDPEHGRPYSLRYIGAMVADFHRTLLQGGIFAYPGDTKNPNGKLRLLYEAAPMAWIAEAAGGNAVSHQKRILDIVPEKLHQRTPLWIGSKKDVEDAARFVQS